MNRLNLIRKRSGAIVPMIALMLPVFIALIVFAVDYGVISLSKHQLQNASDAGAVAALQAYGADRELGDKVAFEVINANQLLGSAIELNTMRSVEYGTWDAGSQAFTPISRTFGGNTSNVKASQNLSGNSIPFGASAVRITLERSERTGNAVGLFFGRVLGVANANIKAVSVATGTPKAIGFIGIESATVLNDARTDSYNSDVGPYGGTNRMENGGVLSRGPITLASGADIFGTAQGAPVTIRQGSGVTVSGNTINTPIADQFDTIDFDLGNLNNNSDIARGPVWAPPFYNSSTNDLVINNGRQLTLEAGTYRFRNVNLAGGSRLMINGKVEIFVEGELRFDNGTLANLSQQPKNFRLNVGRGPVNIQGGHQLHAVIYAPEADVSIANGSGFFGNIIGRTLNFAGGGGLHFDESTVEEDDLSTSSPVLVY